MLLINTMSLVSEDSEDLHESEPAQYAILSHTLEKGQEVTHQEFEKISCTENWSNKIGIEKIRSCSKQAEADGYLSAWIDVRRPDLYMYTENNDSFQT